MMMRKTMINSVARRLLNLATTSRDAPVQLPSLVEDDFDASLPVRLGPPPSEDILFDKCTEDLSHLAPELKPTFNLSAYADKSKTLQELLKLGVDLSRLERIKGVPEVILKLNFDRDVRQYIQFLTGVGVNPDDLGYFFTKNPYIFNEDINDLVVRVNYLEAKRFSSESITRILTRNPKWLLYKTQDIDSRLGFFQGMFKLIGTEVRQLAIRMPKLITYNRRQIEVSKFSVNEEMGFSEVESKAILLNKPKIYALSRNHLLERFDLVHTEMKLSHERIVAEPSILLCRKSKIRERHLFLVEIKRAQYDPTRPGYVSLKALVSGSDADFCSNVAGTEFAALSAPARILLRMVPSWCRMLYGLEYNNFLSTSGERFHFLGRKACRK